MGVWASERESDCENAFYHRHELRTVSIITSAIGMKLLSISHRKLHKHARTHSFHIRFEQKKQQQQRWWWQQQRHQQQIMAINHTNVEEKSCYRNSSIPLWVLVCCMRVAIPLGGRCYLYVCWYVLVSFSLFFFLVCCECVCERCVTASFIAFYDSFCVPRTLHE